MKIFETTITEINNLIALLIIIKKKKKIENLKVIAEKLNVPPDVFSSFKKKL